MRPASRHQARVPAGTHVLSEAELETIHADVAALADDWLADVQTATHSFAQRPQTLVLDLEFKRMKAGWPEMADGSQRPASFIYKQVRVLDSASKFAANDARAKLLPLDIQSGVRT